MATLLKGNIIIAKDDFNINFPGGTILITAGESFTVKNLIGLDFAVQLSESNAEFTFFTIKEFPDHVLLPIDCINKFEDLTDVDIEEFFLDKDLKINNRIKKYIK
jgi:hypothetical protein